jgi:hypothetical protein
MKLEKYILSPENESDVFSFQSYESKDQLLHLLNIRNQNASKNQALCFPFFDLILKRQDFSQYTCALQTLDEFYFSKRPNTNA